MGGSGAWGCQAAAEENSWCSSAGRAGVHAGEFTATTAGGGALIYSEVAILTKRISPREDPLPLRNLLVFIKKAINKARGGRESALARLQPEAVGIAQPQCRRHGEKGFCPQGFPAWGGPIAPPAFAVSLLELSLTPWLGQCHEGCAHVPRAAQPHNDLNPGVAASFSLACGNSGL